MTDKKEHTGKIAIGLAAAALFIIGGIWITGERDTADDLVTMSELARETCGEGNIRRVSIAEPNPGFECKAPRPATAGS